MPMIDFIEPYFPTIIDYAVKLFGAVIAGVIGVLLGMNRLQNALERRNENEARIKKLRSDATHDVLLNALLGTKLNEALKELADLRGEKFIPWEDRGWQPLDEKTWL